MSHGRFGRENDRWGFTQASAIRVTGRHMINIWRAMRGELNLTQYTLENVTFHLLHRRLSNQVRTLYLTLTESLIIPMATLQSGIKTLISKSEFGFSNTIGQDASLTWKYWKHKNSWREYGVILL
jgi:DNA polymerase elongation subunit (family B)